MRWQVLKNGMPVRVCGTEREADDAYAEFDADEIRPVEDEEPEARCCICQRPYKGYGNSAEPVAAGRCCDLCNMSVVIPARLQAAVGI